MEPAQNIEKKEKKSIPQIKGSEFESDKDPMHVIESPTKRAYIFVKSGKSYKRIPYDQIQYIKASGAYCDIMLSDRSHTISASLNKVLDQLDTEILVRCHRSFAVNIDMISSFDDTTIKLDCKQDRITLPISMTYRSELMDVLPRLKSS